MILLIRFFLISLIAYLVVRSFSNYRDAAKEPDEGRNSGTDKSPQIRKVSKETGEYVDYEEVE